jgi:hypothetical protein
MDSIDEDLWGQAKTVQLKQEHIPWFFYPGTQDKIRVGSYGGTQAHSVTHRAFLELAVFDTVAAFWESFSQPQVYSTMVLTSYHKLLRRSVTKELMPPTNPTEMVRCPLILQPWLKRTLCLLSHDEESRNLVEIYGYPTHLLDDGAFSILGQDFMFVLIGLFYHPLRFQENRLSFQVPENPPSLYSPPYWKCPFLLVQYEAVVAAISSRKHDQRM